jgi:peptidyl-prolyl cis-trans isomerase SurA
MPWQSKLAKSSALLVLIITTHLPTNCFADELVEKTVALVNNEPILLSDIKQLERRLSKSSMIDDLLLFDLPIESLKKDKKAQLQFLINERIVDSEVKRNNLGVTMDRVDQEIREIAKRNNISKEDLLKTLQTQGINSSDYQSFMKQRIERQSIVEQEITSKIRLSDEDVLAFYSGQTGKKFNKINEYSISHIFFNPQKGGAEQAYSRAKGVLEQIKSGTSFEKALSKSTEETSPAAGGMLGTFKSGEFSVEMEKAVKDLNIGEVSDVVKSRSGFHILKLVQKKLIADPDFEKNKEKYRALLFEKVFKRQLKAWIDLKREEASITLN